MNLNTIQIVRSSVSEPRLKATEPEPMANINYTVISSIYKIYKINDLLYILIDSK